MTENNKNNQINKKTQVNIKKENNNFIKNLLNKI